MKDSDDYISISSEDYPDLYQKANRASLTAQKYHLLLIAFNLSFLIIATILSFFSDDSKILLILSGISFILALFISLMTAALKFDRVWYIGRSVAESVKTRTWRYMMRAEPFNSANSKARKDLIEDFDQILRENKNIAEHFPRLRIAQNQITEKMEAIRKMSLADRVEIYKTHRIDEQKEWYSNKAYCNKSAMIKWYIALYISQLLAVIFVFLKVGNLDFTQFPIEVFAAIAAAIISWMQTKRYQELSTSYNLTAQEISLAKDKICDISNESSFSIYVSDAENVFSREHTKWQARRDI